VGDYPIRQLGLYQKDFGWVAFWELDPEVLGSISLMSSATWGRVEITSAESPHNWVRRVVPLLNYAMAFILQLRKSTESLSQGSRVADFAVFLGTASADLLSISSPRLPVGTSVSPRSAKVPSKLPD
jgi:hypothetical protein